MNTRTDGGGDRGDFAGILEAHMDSSKVIDDPDLLASVACDESHCDPAVPDLLVRAKSEEDVSSLLRIAGERGVPVTPRGGGTGKCGGAIPEQGGVVVDLTPMNRIIEIDRENLLAVVEPGVVTKDLQDAVEAEGLFYPPDPNSLETCTIGGNAAHNAGGPRAFKYGVTREYVLGTRTALMGGEIIPTGKKTIKGVAGYDLTSLLVGSEGTLGIFTELTLRLVRRPKSLATLLVEFDDEVRAGKAVAAAVAAGLVPRVLEFMDGAMVEVMRSTGADGVREGVGALLLVEFDGVDERVVEEDSVRFAELCEGVGCKEVFMARHGGERDKLWQARRTLSDAVKERAAFKVSEDIVVPRANAPRMLEGLRGIAGRHDVFVPSYGHAGDGNYHVNILWDDPDFDPTGAVKDLFALTLKLDGTITGEHGVGIAKRPYLSMELDPGTVELMKKVKSCFDPAGLLNPGKIFG